MWIFGSLYILLTLILFLGSFILKKSLLRLVARLLAGALVIPLLLVGGLLILFWESEPPTLGELQHKFPSRQSDLETILRMSDEDAQFWRIAPDFLWREAKGSMEGGEFMGGDPNAGLTACGATGHFPTWRTTKFDGATSILISVRGTATISSHTLRPA
jgi:hypothetical protein